MHGDNDGHDHHDHGADHAHTDHDHDHHGHDHHADGDHHSDDHDHDDHAHDDHDHEHGSGDIDAHIWLDPVNAIAMMERVTAVLAEQDPDHATLYRANLAALVEKYIGLTETLETELLPAVDQPIIVFHDAYQYMENRFDLNVVGSITVNPEIPPSAARIAEIRDRIEAFGVVCVMAEPQFSDRVVGAIAEGTGVNVRVLDPLGGTVTPGVDHYETMMRRAADAVLDCVAG